MSEEDKRAIESVESMFGDITIEELIKDKDFNITIFSLGILDILRVIAIVENLQEEIKEKSTIIMAGAEKVKQLEKEIQRLEKDNDTLSELVIVNEDKVIKELDLISKDKIREIFQFYIERDSLFNDDTHKMAVIRLKDVLKELLEEK